MKRLEVSPMRLGNTSGWSAGTSLQIPVSNFTYEENGESVALPWLRPRDILEHLLGAFPWLLLGGCEVGEGAQQLLSTFWKTYRTQHASHEVFQGNEDRLSQTIPLCLHGDGARTQKKQPLEIVSIEAVLGLDTQPMLDLFCNCKRQPDSNTSGLACGLADPLVQKLNHKHHTYLTRFLVFAFPSKKYDVKLPGLLRAFLEEASKDLGALCEHGIRLPTGTFYFAFLGYKGDMEYHAKTGLLVRSYKNVGTKNHIPCCHECGAGSIRFPFEDFTPQPSWSTTLYESVPWREEPPFRGIKFEASWAAGKAASWFRRDSFHILRHGVARNFFASALILLALEGFFDDPADPSEDLGQRLASAWAHFRLWCETIGTSPATVRSFSREKLHFQTLSSFPYIGCKGSDTILFLRWLQLFLRTQLATETTPAMFVMLQQMLRCANGAIEFQCIHHHGIWLRRQCAQRIHKACRDFCGGYCLLADMCLNSRRTLFGMVPKIHALDHFRWELQCALEEQRCVTLNPCVFDCSMNEDFVGRLARQSRRIGFKKVNHNLILAYLVKAKTVIKKFKRSGQHLQRQ